MPERIKEPTLAMRSPRHVVVLDWIPTAVRACANRSLHECIGVVAEHLDAARWLTQVSGRNPAIAFRLSDEEGGAADAQANHTPQVL